MVLLHRIAKGGASLVGLGQEAYANRQQKKDASLNDREGSNVVDGNLYRGGSTEPPPPYEATSGEPQNLSHNQAAQNDQSSSVQSIGLPAPVIIPQRRPNARSRGFVNAYAPALMDCGIDQETFLKFLDGFRAESEKGTAFNAVNLAVGNWPARLPSTIADTSLCISKIATTDWAIELAELSPSPSMHFVALAAHLSIEAGKRLYVNKKTNEYLKEKNETIFQPQGLIAMIMTYVPSKKTLYETVTFDTQAAAAAANTSSNPNVSTKFQTASAQTLEAQMPEICSLVFPSEDHSNESGFKRAIEFTKDYYDRRTQAAYAAHHPDSTLNVQEHEFAGRYADPTTFENSCVLGVLTGGAVDPRARVKERRVAKRADKPAENQCRGGLVSLAKGKLRESVLYLLVVNMPSREEMAYAAQVLVKAESCD